MTVENVIRGCLSELCLLMNSWWQDEKRTGMMMTGEDRGRLFSILHV